MNIIDSILRQCRINAEQPAICAPGTRFDLVTYAQLEYMINNITRALLPLGFEVGQVVGIFVEDKIFHIALMLSLMRIGVITVSCGGPSLPSELGAAAIISDKSLPLPGAKRTILANPDWVRGGAQPVVDPRLHQANGDEICRIIMTSGSTGTPKAVAWTHRMLIEMNTALTYSYGGRWPQASRLYCDLGLPSAPAFRYGCNMLMRGGMILFYGADAYATEQSLDAFKIESMVTTPRNLGEHIKFYEQTPVRCSLDNIVVVGGSLSKQLAERAWAVMCPRLVSYYGATEVGSVASADAREIVDIPNAAGYVLPHATVEITDESDNVLGPNTEGIVRIRTPQMIDSYMGHSDELSEVRGNWFYPGDYGYLSQDGLLAITGRSETRINVGGEKGNPELIEEVIRAYPGIDDVAVLTLPNQLGVEVVYALIKGAGSLDSVALEAHCRSKLMRNFVPARFLAVGQIPRGSTGKIQRSQLAALAKKGLS